MFDLSVALGYGCIAWMAFIFHWLRYYEGLGRVDVNCIDGELAFGQCTPVRLRLFIQNERLGIELACGGNTNRGLERGAFRAGIRPVGYDSWM